MVLYIWKYRRENDSGSFTRIALIENACSVIWVRRYQTAGEFEVYITGSATVMEITETEDASGYRTIPTLGNWSVEK